MTLYTLQDLEEYRTRVSWEADEAIRALLHKARANGLSYVALASRTGLALATITEFSRGKHPLSAGNRHKLINFLARTYHV